MLVRLEALDLAKLVGDLGDNDRFALNCVQFRGNNTVVASNGTSAVRFVSDEEQMGLFDGLLPKSERGFDKDTLIAGDDVASFAAACKKQRKGADAIHVVIGRSGKNVTLATADGSVERRFLLKEKADDVKYPAIDRLIVKAGRDRVTVSIKELKSVLAVAASIGANYATLGFKDAESPLLIEAKSSAGSFDGVVMAARSGEPEEKDKE